MTRTRWIIFVLLCAAILGGLVLLSKKDSVSVDDIDAAQIISKTDTAIGDNVYGNADSKVVLIEYGDFQCPGCGAAYAQVKAVKEEYKDKIAFVFRSFPLTSIHPNALAASTAAEAAGLQGKFWEMHDKLYENQAAWSSIDASKRTDLFAGYAEDLGLDVEKFKNDLSDPRVSAKVNRDRALANKLGVNSTPTFYIGSEKLTTEETTDLVQKDAALLKAKIEAALKKNSVKKTDTTESKPASDGEALPQQ